MVIPDYLIAEAKALGAALQICWQGYLKPQA
jgi:hypothetical protein